MEPAVLAPSPHGRVRLHVSIPRLLHNYRLLAGRCRAIRSSPIAVVKANAYGHGAVPIAKALAEAGADFFAVSSLEEGLALRPHLPHAKILTLGYVPPSAARLAAEAGLTLAVFDTAYARALSESLGNQSLSVHVKVNSGMNRLGFSLARDRLSETVSEISELFSLRGLAPTGIFSHLATADIPHASYTSEAVASFRTVLGALALRGIRLPSHIAASAALLSGEGAGFPLSRFGLALYGYSPTREDLGLLPVARLCCDIAQRYTAPAGAPVGYGATYITKQRECIGILPVGYADGLPRAAQGAFVTVGGVPCPLVGRISMDAAAVLLTDAPTDATTCTLFGDTPDSLWQLADAAGTIPNEILARLGPRVDRIYENEGSLYSHSG